MAILIVLMKLTYFVCIMYSYLRSMQPWMPSQNVGITIQFQQNNRTPNQLFIEGALNQQTQTQVLAGGGYNTIPSSNTLVDVPRANFFPCEQLLRDLEGLRISTDESDFQDLGFRRICRFVGRHLLQCDDCI